LNFGITRITSGTRQQRERDHSAASLLKLRKELYRYRHRSYTGVQDCYTKLLFFARKAYAASFASEMASIGAFTSLPNLIDGACFASPFR